MYSLLEIFRNWGIDKEAILSLNKSNNTLILNAMGLDVEELANKASFVEQQKNKSLETAEIRKIQTIIRELAVNIKKIRENFTSQINMLRAENNRLNMALKELTKNYEHLKQEVNARNARLDVINAKQIQKISQKQQKRLDKPVDRNGVAPSEVSLEKYFNFSHKRF